MGTWPWIKVGCTLHWEYLKMHGPCCPDGPASGSSSSDVGDVVSGGSSSSEDASPKGVVG